MHRLPTVCLSALLLVCSVFPLAAKSVLKPRNFTPEGLPNAEDLRNISLYLAFCALPPTANYVSIGFVRNDGFVEEYLYTKATGLPVRWQSKFLQVRPAGAIGLIPRDGSLWVSQGAAARERVRASHFLVLPPGEALPATGIITATPPRNVAPIHVRFSGRRIDISQADQTIIQNLKIEWWEEFPRVRD